MSTTTSPRVAGLSRERRQRLQEMLSREGVDLPVAGTVRRRADGSRAPLSLAQERMWFLDQLRPASAAYNTFFGFELSGPLAVDALTDSVNEIVRRHEVLRATFHAAEGEATQRIAPYRRVAIPLTDLSGLSTDHRHAEVSRRAAAAARTPFDLTRGPLLRVELLKRGEDDHVLLLTVHHIVFDGGSLEVLLRELAECYDAFTSGRGSPVEELPIQYADFAQWQREQLEGDAFNDHLAYWKFRLDRLPARSALPYDFPPSGIHGFRGAKVRRSLPPGLSDAVRKLARAEKATPFMTLLAAFTVLLHSCTGADDIVVGSPVSQRTDSALEPLIGLFVNLVVLRTDASGDPSFRELLERVRETTLGAHEHQDVPFERIVDELQVDRHVSHAPLAQAVFAMQPASGVPRLRGLEVTPMILETGTAKFDLTLSISDSSRGLIAIAEYNTELFEGATIGRMLEQFERVVAGVTADPARRLSELTFLTPEERQTLLVDWNRTATDYPRESSIADVFEAQAARTPAAPAVAFEGTALTYAELNIAANRLAHHLRAAGTGPEVVVAVCLERSLEAIVAFLAILKAGGAYLPLDPGQPRERLEFMLEDQRAPIVITEARFANLLPGHRTIVALDRDERSIGQRSETNPRVPVDAENLAYVMYTSGSTGRPKGVGVVQRGVVRLVKRTNYVRFGPGETILQFAPLSFDASTFEIWGSLLNGGALVVSHPGMPSLEDLAHALRRHRVTTIWLTAGLFHPMVETQVEALAGVGQVLAGGDALSVPHVRKFLECSTRSRLINGYGPTECTTFSACCHLTQATRLGTGAPIGRPIANTELFVLNRRLDPVPIGAIGELYIGGDGLGRGYINRPDLTAAAFVPHPFSQTPGARLYRTGDLARYRPDGDVDFLGRRDQQLKIRGFRIEPGEIAAVLTEHPLVSDAIVVARDDGPEKQLVAYVVPASGVRIDVDALRTDLRSRLPSYMIPAALVTMPALPLTANGKVDRRALPDPSGERPIANTPVPPRTVVEETLAGIWRDVLRVDAVGVYDNFFDLGGHSLGVARVVARVRTALGVEIPIRILFEEPTIAGLARAIADVRPAGAARSTPTIAAVPRDAYRVPRADSHDVPSA